MNSFVMHLTSVDVVSHIKKVVQLNFLSNVLSYRPDMMPNSFSSVVQKFELLTALNQSMTFLTNCLTNSQSLNV